MENAVMTKLGGSLFGSLYRPIDVSIAYTSLHSARRTYMFICFSLDTVSQQFQRKLFLQPYFGKFIKM